MIYPIKTAQPARTIDELLDVLTEVGVNQDVTGATWDQTAQRCVLCIKRVRNRVRRRRKAVVRRIQAQSRAHLSSRHELLEVRVEEAREKYLVRLGQRLERTKELLCWNYKRVSNYEKDQTISTIRHITGAAFKREMTTADKFASEWKPIFGVIHNMSSTEHLDTAFDEFVQIPASRHASDRNNGQLMGAITMEEIIQAISKLNRHKAAGADGL